MREGANEAIQETPYVFLPYQQRWVADESTVKIAEKSRRIGLTWAEAGDAVLQAATKNGQDVFYISYNMEFTKEFVQTCSAWARSIDKAVSEMEEVILKDEDKDITAYRIVFSSGHKIMGLPSRPTTLRGRQGIVIIDEAAFCEDLKELIKAAIALLMWGGKVRIISTHNGEDNYFNELVKDTLSGKLDYSHHKTNINDALKEGLFERICQVKGEQWSREKEEAWLEDLIKKAGDGANEEFFCIPSRSGTKYFPRALVERAMVATIPVLSYEQTEEFTYLDDRVRLVTTAAWLKEDLEFVLRNSNTDNGRRGYIGMDFARSGDLSVIAVFLEGKQMELDAVCYVELRNVPFAQQFQIFCFIADKLPGFSCSAIDARGNGQMIAELAAQKYGPAYVHQVMISRQFYMEYMPKYKAKFEDGEISIPKKTEILDDHRTVTMEKGIPLITERSKDEKRLKRHGDSVVAGVMAVYAQVNDDNTYQPYQYEVARAGNPWLGGDDDEQWD